MACIPLNQKQIERVKELASQIADHVQEFIADHSSLSVERAVLRLYGVDGLAECGAPLSNRVVDIWKTSGDISAGISRPFAAAMLASDSSAQKTAEMIAQGKLKLDDLTEQVSAEVIKKENKLAENAVALLKASKNKKEQKIHGIEQGICRLL